MEELGELFRWLSEKDSYPVGEPARRYLFCGTIREPSFENGPPAVSRHATLRRPDFPPRPEGRGDCPSGKPMMSLASGQRRKKCISSIFGVLRERVP